MEKYDDGSNKSSKSRSRSRSRSLEKKNDENKIENVEKTDKGIKNFYDLLECFKENRKEFLFRVSFEDGFFYDKNAKNYLSSIIKRKLGNDGKIIEMKRISVINPKEEEFFYFR